MWVKVNQSILPLEFQMWLSALFLAAVTQVCLHFSWKPFYILREIVWPLLLLFCMFVFCWRTVVHEMTYITTISNFQLFRCLKCCQFLFCNICGFDIYFVFVFWLLYTGCPKNALSECGWSHSALAQSEVASTPCVLKLIFRSFLTKTKPGQAFPSHVYGKI